MNPFSKLLLCLLLLAVIQSGCKKNKDDPQIFSYGPYKFAAKVNGQAFVPSGVTGIVSPLDISFYQGTNPAITNLYILAYRTETNTHISLYIKNITGPGRYPLNTVTAGYPFQTEPPHYGMYETEKINGMTNYFITNTIDTGYIDISEYKLTNNVQNNVVKGTFYFKARSLTDGTVVEITNGYFSKNI